MTIRENAPKTKRWKRSLVYTGIVLGALVGTPVTTCSIQAYRFDKNVKELPCKKLNLPDAAGAKPLTESICVAVSGRQPKKIGIETHVLSKNKKAHTLFLEWTFDGYTESIKKTIPDAEPITLITVDGKPVEIHIRSHWRVGVHKFDDCKNSSGKVLVAVTNAFHTPVVPGCDVKITNPKKKDFFNTFIFKSVSRYAKAVGQWYLDTFKPLRNANKNEVPDNGHRARTQPLFSAK